MANILYLVRTPLDGQDNLHAKFAGQMAAMRRLGHTVHHLAWDRRGLWLCGEGQPRLVRRAHGANLPAYSHYLLYKDLMAALENLDTAYDLVYMRYMPVFAGAPRALKKCKRRGAKLVVEHHTFPFRYARSSALWMQPFFWYNDRVFDRIAPLVDLHAVMGDAPQTLLGRPVISITNGVAVDSLPLHQGLKEPADLHMLALASMSCWQGYDRLIRAMAAYPGPEKVVLHLAGSEGDGSLAAWMKLAQEESLGDRVVYEGELHGEKLDALVDRCDIGVGSLAIYKRRIQNVITLKLREYMARGLPFLYTVEKTDVPWEEAFSLQVPNDDSPIDMARVAAFIHRVRADADISRRMRAHAARYMTWDPIMRSVLERVGL